MTVKSLQYMFQSHPPGLETSTALKIRLDGMNTPQFCMNGPLKSASCEAKSQGFKLIIIVVLVTLTLVVLPVLSLTGMMKGFHSNTEYGRSPSRELCLTVGLLR